MPTQESPSLYIDFSRLPPPKVIEEIDYEVLLDRYRESVVAKNPKLARAVQLEQSPTNIILETEAFGETLLRARVNDAARAVMLPFSTGADLDVLAAFYNVQRIVVPATTNTPEIRESDARLLRRTQMAAEAFNTAGAEGAYIFHSLSADPTIRDVSAKLVNTEAHIKITVMNEGADPLPTAAQIQAVTTRLNKKHIRPMTDVVFVDSPEVIETDVVANITLYPGPNASLIQADLQKGLDRIRTNISILGRDLTRSAIIAALTVEGVQDVELLSPAADIAIDLDQCVKIKSATINILGVRVE